MSHPPESELPADHRSGFVALIGKSNVGKSTLINALLGQSIAPVAPKPQTTRRRQRAILTLPQAQLIFVDTPGLHRARHKLGEHMNEQALGILPDVDLILALFDLSMPLDEDDERVAALLDDLKEIPVLVALTKNDLVSQDEFQERRRAVEALLGGKSIHSAISARRGENLDALLEAMVQHLPQGPRLYPADTVTDAYERDIAADLIRAAGLQLLHQEVPHGLAVRIDDYKERGESGAYIAATIFVERESQKGIVIGKGGSMLRNLGTLARQEIERMSERKVFLELRVKVLPNWRNDEALLQRFGFNDE